MGNAQTKPPERHEMAEKTGVFALESKGLVEIPSKVWGIANLRTLDLSHNRIAKLPAKVRGLAPKLKTLALTDNRLSDLPDELCECKELQTLSLGQNSLTSLPDALGALGKLKTLVLAHNRLVALPESMCALQSLQQLDASHNKLRALPAAFGALCMLAHADLSDNELGGEGLPDGLGALKRLKELDLHGNAPLVVHARLPPELLLDTPLQRLELDPDLLGTDGLLLEDVAGSAEAQQAYITRRKARIDKEVHAKERGGEIHFKQ